ncbi:transporter [Acidihalobacter aeolianus]|uniref:Transporter n=1 Tax=Acidihalobacter aeolianus TaxID=2792603 RepID=A0A1D8KC98_9GAMM|nr:sodium-dependent transporter [Acidihalobacter aeolianus]AOV18556.1 transporter [Acidihalobacter aeolianus]
MRRLKSIHGEWSSGTAFFLSATGAVVGLGNIWKYPYIAGQHGGGAFLLVYLLSMFVVGLPLLMAELLLGRRGRGSPPSALRDLAADEGQWRAWSGVGFFAVLAGLLILSFYSVIAGWGLDYIWMSAAGTYKGASAGQVQGLFSALNDTPWRLMAWHSLFMVMTVAVVARGVRQGLERVARLFVPLMFILLAFLDLYAAVAGNLVKAAAYLFDPDFSAVNGKTVLIALGHAFFTLSLGVGTMLAYGAYLPERVSVFRASLWIILADTCAGLLAGMAIYPLVFAHDLPSMQGPGLIFTVLPMAYGHSPYGGVFGVMFYTVLVLAAWTSAIALLEPAVAWWVEMGISRAKAALALGFAVWLLGLVTIMSFSVWSGVLILGHTWFGLLDAVTGNVMLPVVGLLVAVFAGWMMTGRSLRQELSWSRGVFRIWLTVIRYVTPVAMLLVLLNAMGLIRGGI